MANDGIYIKIDGDSADYQKALSDALKTTEKFDKKTQESLDKLKKKFDDVGGGTDKFGKGTDQASGKVKRFNGIVGQAGFQVQDLAVQLQSGTSAFVAFGQQGSQLAGAFGPGGAVIGAIIAVGAALGGVLVGSLTSAASNVEELSEKILQLNEDMKTLTKSQREFLAAEERKNIAETRKEYDKLIEKAGELRQKLEDAQAGELKIGGRKVTSAVRIEEEVKKIQEDLLALDSAVDLSFQEIEAGEKRIAEILGKTSEDVEDSTKKNQDAVEALIASLKMQNDTFGESESFIANYVAQLKGATDEQLKEIDALAKSIEKKKLDAEAQEKLNKQLEKSNQLRQRWVEIEAENERARARQAEGLINQLLTTEEMASKIREERLDALKAFNAKELEELGGHAEAKRRIEEDYQKAVSTIQKTEYGTRNQLLIQSFGDIASLMNTENRKLFEIGKVAAIAQATITGYEAAQASYKWGAYLGGPVGGAAAAAASLVATGVQISNIASTQFGSKSAPSTNTGGTTSAAAVAPTTQQNVSISLTGDTFTRGQVTGLIDQINEAIADGAEIRLS